MATVRLGRYESEQGDLPPVCMVCGAPATVRKTKNFAWYPPWVIVLVLVAVLVFAVVAAILTKRMRVVGPFCAAHRNHWLSRTLLILFGFLGLAGVGIAGAIVLGVLSSNHVDIGEGLGLYFGLGMAFLFLAWLVGAIVLRHSGVGPSEITDTSITLRGVCEPFAAAVAEDRRRDEDEGHDRRRRGDDDYDRPWRRRRRDRDRDDDEDYGGRRRYRARYRDDED